MTAIGPGRKQTSEDLRARGQHLARQLRRQRERLGLSQQELAERAGVSYATVRKVENGLTPNPGFFTVVSLARVLQVDVEHLAPDADDAENSASGRRWLRDRP